MQQDQGQKYSIAALVCGLLGIVGGFIPIVRYFTLVLSILGIVFGVKGRKLSAQTQSNAELATGGFVLGIIGCVFAGVGIMCAACAIGTFGAVSGLFG